MIKAAKRALRPILKERECARARLAQRDAEYAASPCAARVTVDCVRTTDGRTLVVETRGRVPAGFHAASLVKHS